MDERMKFREEWPSSSKQRTLLQQHPPIKGKYRGGRLMTPEAGNEATRGGLISSTTETSLAVVDGELAEKSLNETTELQEQDHLLPRRSMPTQG